jgi:hypothetical protein
LRQRVCNKKGLRVCKQNQRRPNEPNGSLLCDSELGFATKGFENKVCDKKGERQRVEFVGKEEELPGEEAGAGGGKRRAAICENLCSSSFFLESMASPPYTRARKKKPPKEKNTHHGLLTHKLLPSSSRGQRHNRSGNSYTHKQNPTTRTRTREPNSSRGRKHKSTGYAMD